MITLLIILVLILLLGEGGFYLGGPRYGGGDWFDLGYMPDSLFDGRFPISG
jgi:hypothetical protein